MSPRSRFALSLVALLGCSLAIGARGALDRVGDTMQATRIERREVPAVQQTLREMWEAQRTLPPRDELRVPPEEETLDQKKRGPSAPRLPNPDSSRTANANPTIGATFPGLDLTTNSSIPPDTMGSIGANHVIELINGRLGFFYKNGTRLADISIEAFFNVPGVPTNFVYDPHIVYDAGSGRFIACAVEGSASPNSYLMLAVSATSDPTGLWYKWAIDADVDNGTTQTQNWMDYPQLGYDSSAVYVSGNMFPNTGVVVRPKVLIIPKAQLLSGSAAITWSENNALTGVTNVLPAVSVGTPAAEYMVTLFFDNSTETYTELRVYGITNPTSTPTTTLLSSIAVPSLGDPPNAPQVGGSALLESGTARFINAVWRNNAIWTGHAINISNRAAVRWYQISTTGTPVLAQSGDIADANRFYFYPSVGVNSAGDVLFGFAGSAPNEYVGAYCAGRQTGDPVGLTSAPFVIKAGEAYYAEDAGTGRVRWGDYSATPVDPTNDITFWTVQEFARAPSSTWATQWARVNLTPAAPPPDPPGQPPPGTGTSNVVTNTNDSGAGSLRNAINYANAHPGTTITFNIPASDPNFAGGVFTIRPATALPMITANNTIIDGATQSAFGGNTNASGPEMVLSGANAGLLSDGLRITAASCVVKEISVSSFTGAGVKISGASANGNSIVGCYVGTNAGATAAAGNGDGVAINNGAPNTAIDGTTLSGRNIISGNLEDDVIIDGAGTNNSIVRGNYIGVDASGAALVSNNSTGISVIGGAQSTVIGGTTAAQRNVVAGHYTGLLLTGVGTNNAIVQGNYVGTNAAGTAGLGNNARGIRMRNGASFNLIGGTLAGAGNLVSGNNTDGTISGAGVEITSVGTTGNIVQGNFIGTNAAGIGAIANKGSGVRITGGANANTIGGLTSSGRNIISANASTGITLDGNGTGANLVQGNYIGLAANGGFLGNGSHGIAITRGTANNTIGGATTGARNVIGGNTGAGVFMDTATVNNLVQGNFIGTDPTGLVRRNNADAVKLSGAVGTKIFNNVIAASSGNGVAMTGASNNLVQGNLIGLGVDGTTPLTVSGAGVAMTTSLSANNTIGGPTAAERNVIASAGTGVSVSGPASDNNIVQGNFIGTDVTGTLPRGCSTGVLVSGNARFTQILNNVIAGSTNYGVDLESTSSGTVVQANRIGTDVTGATGMGNLGGVFISSSNGNTIGGAAVGQGNRIAYNRGVGVAVSSGTQNAIRRNAIYANQLLGIDLDVTGVNPNDTGDGDIGGNNLQNFPVLSSAGVSAAGTTVAGSFNSTANSAFTVEFFLSTACNGPAPADCGEGEILLGSVVVNTNGSGDGGFNLVLPLRVPSGQVITATATDPDGNTSEFSHCANTTMVDSDGDGLPDDYEIANGLNPNNPNDALADRDGDGASNLEEFYAGTNPNSASSVPRITGATRIADGFPMLFPTVNGWLYRMEYNNNISDPFGWILLVDQVVGTGGIVELVDPGAAAVTQRFYRLSPAVHFPPPNDRFANAAIISGMNGNAGGSNIAATRQAGEPDHAGNAGGASVWYRWTAPITANATFVTSGSDFDTLLGVYTGTSVNALTSIASSDNVSNNDLTSSATFSAIAGTTYLVAVDGANLSQGHIKLGWSTVVPPSNDNFASPQLVSGDSGSVTGNNALASKETGEPDHAGNIGGHSLWYNWSSPTAGSVTFNTAGSNFDTLLGVYTGSSVNALTTVASNDDFGASTSQVTFIAASNTVYHIALDGFNGATGGVVLNWQRP
jgi:hypothetical protein